jgi:type IV pilus assembly protein PilW
MKIMHSRQSTIQVRRTQTGLTMVELMVALAIGSFLMIGAMQIFNQSRQTFIINESIARVQETAQFAMDTIEADLRMASNWGRSSRPLAVDGRSIDGVANPNDLALPAAALACGDDWPLNLAMTVDGSDNNFTLPCAAAGTGGAQANSDVVTVRRVTVLPVANLNGRLQVQTTRVAGQLFIDGNPTLCVPAGPGLPVNCTTHNLLVNSYYVAASSELIPGVPTLRRKSLAMVGGAMTIVDQEVAPGVENLQVQFGIDVNEDNTVDRYVDPGDPIYDPTALGYIPGARVMTARVWLVIRGVTREVGIIDTQNYTPGDVDLGVPSDDYRRMQVSKTILLRNART